jgi:phage-related protein
MEPLAYTLGGIALAVLAIRAGMVLWAAAQTVWAGATAIATGAQWLWNTALLASPITWIIIAIIALVVIIVLIATKTTWFQTIWHTVWGGIKTAFNATINWFKGVFAWFGTLPGKFAGWFGAAKDWAVSKFTSLVNWVKGLPGRIGSALSSLAGTLRGKASSAFQSMRDAASSKASALMSWAAGIPGRIAKAVGGMGSLLRDKGKNVIQGLWNGISSMGGWIWGKIKSFIKNNVVDSVTSFLHIGSPSKLMADEVGHWLPPGIAQGAEANRGVLDKTMQGLVDPQAAMPSAPLTTGMAPLMGASAGGGAVLVRFEMAGAEDDFHRLMRKLTRVKGRGNVQVAFGQ